MMRRHLLTFLLLAPSACFADDWGGFRSDITNADAVVRFSTAGIKALAGSDVEVTASIEKVFKGEGLNAGDQPALLHHAADWETRLGAELSCPGGVSAGGIPFFSKVPAAGGSCIGLLKKAGSGWELLECCLAEPAGGLSFTSAEQAKAYGEERRKAAAYADELMELYVHAAAVTGDQASIDLGVAITHYFRAGGGRDAALAVGVLLDDSKRIEGMLSVADERFREAVATALQNWLDGNANDTIEARLCRPFLVAHMEDPERRKIMPTLVADLRKTKKSLDDWMAKKPDPKKPESEADASARAAAPKLVAKAKELVLIGLDPLRPEQDMSTDEVIEAGETFANQ